MDTTGLTWLHIEDLRFHMPLGVYDWEQEAGTDVRITLRLAYDASRAAATDQLDFAPDYARLCQLVEELCQQPCRLAEHLAEKIVISVLREFKMLEVAEVEVQKLQPAVPGHPRAFVVIRRVCREKRKIG